jgi:hypothetical protein
MNGWMEDGRGRERMREEERDSETVRETEDENLRNVNFPSGKLTRES